VESSAEFSMSLNLCKPDHPIFSASVRCGVCVAIVFHSSHLGIWAFIEYETLLTIYIASLLIEWHTYTED
jgi:hypothetical protein